MKVIVAYHRYLAISRCIEEGIECGGDSQRGCADGSVGTSSKSGEVAAKEKASELSSNLEVAKERGDMPLGPKAAAEKTTAMGEAKLVRLVSEVSVARVERD